MYVAKVYVNFSSSNIRLPQESPGRQKPTATLFHKFKLKYIIRLKWKLFHCEKLQPLQNSTNDDSKVITRHNGLTPCMLSSVPPAEWKAIFLIFHWLRTTTADCQRCSAGWSRHPALTMLGIVNELWPFVLYSHPLPIVPTFPDVS